MPDGEVAVRQNGHEHAVSTPKLDSQVYVDLDHDAGPHLELPPGVDVSFRDEADLETDGGTTADRSEVFMRGSGLGEFWSKVSIYGGIALVASAGYLWGYAAVGTTFMAAVTLFAGALLGWIGGRSYWSDRT